MKKLDNTLIIGIGNNTRQDDGLGWCFIDELEKICFNNDHLLQKYQLMVEDADLIVTYENVIFVDASKNEIKNGFSIEQIFPAKEFAFSTHSIPPDQVLNLCKIVYNKTPKAYLIAIEGYEWDIKIGLSKRAFINLINAKNHFLNFIKGIY
ncbi:hydrogenase maturation protease [Lutibacter sp.]|uniref:hydrogenase maturation protease n=1 Tax=Lutibacter sp. TaxID=1925666 RepID=UPI0027372227|nr:hydrogenase maturation protease [Lutibacter sp.]MDP3312814.1 hydrogenase maturation protease [Lutibacter sp.]